MAIEKTKIKKLKNGLTVIFHHYPNFNSVYFNMSVKVGSRYENKNNNGLAHLVEHILVKNVSDKLKLSKWIKNYIDEDFNGYTYKDRTEYEMNAHKDDIEKVLQVMGDCLFSKKISQEDIRVGKDIILEELMTEKEDIDYNFRQFINNKMFGSNALSMNILGSEKSIKKISKKDVWRFFNDFYQPANITLSFSGKIDEKKILNLINKYFHFSFLSKRKDFDFEKFKYRGDKIYFTKGSKERVWFNFFLPWGKIADQKLNYKREFVVWLLKQYLFDFFRSRGSCYSFDVESFCLEDYSDVGIATSFAGDKTVTFFNELLDKIKNFSVSLSSLDLKYAKDNKLKILDIDHDYPKQIMDETLWNYFIFGSIISWSEKKKIIHSISLEEVRAIVDELIGGQKGTVFFAGNFSVDLKNKINKIYLR